MADTDGQIRGRVTALSVGRRNVHGSAVSFPRPPQLGCDVFARTWPEAWDEPRELAHALVLDLDRGRELDLDVDWCGALHLARNLASFLDLEHDGADGAAVLIARELARTLTLDRVLSHNLNRLVHGVHLAGDTIDVSPASAVRSA